MKKLTLFVFILLLCGDVFSAPTETMTIAPAATDDTVIEAADVNTRNSSISTPFNAHTHTGLCSENSLVVGTTNAGYSTIQSALNAAVANDVVWVHEGTYSETVTFADDNVTLRAIGRAENTIISRTTATAVNFSTKSGCTLDGFTVIVSAADGTTDYCVTSSNDATSDYNIIENCIIDWDASIAINLAEVVKITNGNTIIRDCRMTMDNTYSGTDASNIFAVYFENADTFRFYNNSITVTNAGTTTNATGSAAVLCFGGSTNYIEGNIITVLSAGQTTHINSGIYGDNTTAYIIGNTIDVQASSTGIAFGLRSVTTSYVVGNYMNVTTGDSDGKWNSGGTTMYATGNIITGDCAYTKATTAYAMGNSINGDLINGGGDKIANATEAGAMFWDGIVIGTDNDNNILDDATHGSGVGTLYLGNATVDATFTGFHYYKLGDTDLQAGELVCLKEGKLYRSTIEQDPTVIGLYCGLTNWNDSLGNKVVKPKEVDEEYEKWDKTKKKNIKKTRKVKKHGEPVGVSGQPVQSSDYAYSVAVVGDSMHENMDNPLTGAWVSVDAGTIKNGDYLCSSNKAGYLEKQGINTMMNYTIAKAREDINQDCQNAYIYLLQ